MANKKQNKIEKRNLRLYPLGTIGRDALYQLFNNFIFLFIVFTQNLDSAQLIAITVIMVACRIIDAVTDPIMGAIIEITNTKWGKYKPWLLVGILSCSFIVVAAFNCNFTGWEFVIFFGVVYLLYSITWTIHDISYWGMIAALGSNKDTRNKFVSRTNFCAGLGSGIASMTIPLFTTGTLAIGGNAKTGFGKIAIIITLFAIAFVMFPLLGVKENRDDQNKPKSQFSFKRIVKVIARNKQLLIIAIIFLMQQIANSFVLSGIGSTYIYFEFGYEGGLYSIFSSLGLICAAVIMIIYPKLASVWVRKQILKYMLIVLYVGSAIMLVAGLLIPEQTIKFWIVTIAYSINNASVYSFYLVFMISIFNTVEYNEYKFGQREEAIIASIRPFFTKVASALCVLFTSCIYLCFNINDITNAISDLENKTNAGILAEADKLVQISQVLNNVEPWQNIALMFAIVLIPVILISASYFLYKKYYFIDEDYYDKIVKCDNLSGNLSHQVS